MDTGHCTALMNLTCRYWWNVVVDVTNRSLPPIPAPHTDHLHPYALLTFEYATRSCLFLVVRFCWYPRMSHILPFLSHSWVIYYKALFVINTMSFVRQLLIWLCHDSYYSSESICVERFFLRSMRSELKLVNSLSNRNRCRCTVTNSSNSSADTFIAVMSIDWFSHFQLYNHCDFMLAKPRARSRYFVAKEDCNM